MEEKLESMDADVGMLCIYLETIFNMEKEAEEVIHYTKEFVGSLGAGFPTNCTDQALNNYLTIKMGKPVDCANFGLNNIRRLADNCMTTRRTLFGLLEKHAVGPMKEEIEKRVIEEVNAKLKDQDRKFETSGAKLPGFTRAFITELEDSADASIREEFLAKAKMCESMKQVVAVCDDLKKIVLLKKMNDRIDRLEDEIDDLKNEMSDLTDRFNRF